MLETSKEHLRRLAMRRGLDKRLHLYELARIAEKNKPQNRWLKERHSPLSDIRRRPRAQRKNLLEALQDKLEALSEWLKSDEMAAT
jgi:hypothetical protein